MLERLIPSYAAPAAENVARPAQLFADFVEAHLPGTLIPEAERKRFYRLRSALSHGGKLLLGDHSEWGFTPKRIGEDSDVRALWQIVHTVLHNWLIARYPRARVPRGLSSASPGRDG
jgi:hypothetical protein